jgi:hypothetical protein
MPTIKSLGPTDLDYETALLGGPLTNDTLDVLSDVIDARDAIRDLAALIAHMQTVLENGAPAYPTREQFAVDLEQALDTTRHHIAAILGAEQGIY